jgi:glycosyltransferase involved in cell wall biosynthesis
MVEWYRDLDVLLVTSSAEGTPSVLLEAMACGVPVISTPVGIAPEVAKSERCTEYQGLWLADGYEDAAGATLTVKSIAALVELVIIATPLQRKMMAEQARRTMDRCYSWKQLAENWFKTLLG